MSMKMSKVTFYSVGPHRKLHQPQLTQVNLERGFGKNEGEWTGKVEINKAKIPGSRHSIHSFILTYSRL